MELSLESTFLIFGHRGACGYEPENTLRSLAKALELGVSWVEFDVQTVEGTPLLFHDRSLKRRAGVEGELQAQTLEYVRSLDVGLGERIPLLDEALDLLDGRTGVNIELKGSQSCKAVADLLKRRLGGWWSQDTILVSSFDHEELLAFRKIHPGIRCAPLVKGRPLDLFTTVKSLQAYSVHFDQEFFDPGKVPLLHKEGLRVFVYTVNRSEDSQRLKSLGVDGIFSDLPDQVSPHPVNKA